MGVLDNFKRKIAKIKDAVEEWKNNNPQASKLISGAIHSLPPPFNTFGNIVWDSLKKDDNGPQQMLDLLEKLEKSSSTKFEEITNKIEKLIAKDPPDKEIQDVGLKILNSKREIIDILDSKLEKLSQSLKKLHEKIDFLTSQVQNERNERQIAEEQNRKQIEQIVQGMTLNNKLMEQVLQRRERN